MSAQLNQTNPTPWPIKAIASICALGTGMVAVATVLSSSPGFLVFLLSSIIFNYGTVYLYQLLNRRFPHPASLRETEDDYVQRVLNNFQPLTYDSIPRYGSGGVSLKYTIGIAFTSLALAGAISIATYYLSLMFMPQVVIFSTVAMSLFIPIVFVVYRAFRRGVEDAWKDLNEYSSGKQRQSLLSSSTRNTPAWIWGKRAFITIGAISCVAGGILGAALIHEGVATTARSLFALMGGGMTAVAGPLAWFVFSLLFVCVAGMMARSVLMFIKDDSLDEKMKLKHALFNRKAYLKDLENDWTKVNDAILKTREQAHAAKNAWDLDKSTSNLQACNHAAKALDTLYGHKDTLYHRYAMFSKPWFQPLFATITILMTGFCFLGMLAHMARGSHAGIELMLKVSSISEKLAMGIATGLMWTGLVAETLFTATNVTDTMLEEGIGTQTAQYERKLESQQSRQDALSQFAYPSSRIQHGIFDGALVMNGASGHSSKTGYAFIDRVAMPASFASAVRSSYERDPDTFLVAWDYKKGHSCLLEKPDPVIARNAVTKQSSSI